MGPWLTSLETVTVGDPGNAADTRYATPGYGAVSYTYKIGKYEVTAGQYCQFLNAVAKTWDDRELYDANMDTAVSPFGCNIKCSGMPGNYSYSVASDWANRPVNYVSWFAAARFANWLTNGQPTGREDSTTTEDGAYRAASSYATRKVSAAWAIATQDEWYKAAYYKGGSTNAGYWDYPTQSNTEPGNDMADASGNNANHCSEEVGIPIPIDNGKYTTVVGQFKKSASAYGTFDQGGNVEEINETFLGTGYCDRSVRGGSFAAHVSCISEMSASLRCIYYAPTVASFLGGFRVVQVVPGDINNDGQVNDADYTVWADYFGKTPAATYRTGSSANGGYNDADYTTWANNFGKTLTSKAVPEPATLNLLGMGLLAMIRRRA